MFKKILCPTDGSPTALRAASIAADLARKYDGRLTLFSVAPLHILDLMGPRGSLGPEGLLPKQVEERLSHHSREVVKATLDSLGPEAEGVEVREIMGHPGDEICHLASSEGFDLVVVGSRGQGRLERAILGSVSDYVVRHCKLPVLVVNPQS